MKKYYSNLIFGLLLIFGFHQQVSAQKTFVHPGIPFTQSDLNQLKVNITQEPWLTGYNALRNDYRSQLSFAMRGPFATVTRSPDLNNSAWKIDMVAIHNLTFMFVFTGDVAYAAKATQILDAWAVTNTTWGGGENMLDIGDYAPYFITAADILKSTYSGWTADNTAHVNNYFANVLYPASWVPNPLRDCNKGAIQLQIALGIAAFLDDEVKWNQALESYRMEAGAGLRNSIPSGQVGDTGRDDHWFGQAWALAWDAEVAFKQGNDMFAEMNNRLLAIGELYNHYAIDPTGLTFTPYGGYSVYWTSGWGIATGSRKQHPFNNIIQGAYSVRKGIPTPYTDQMRTLVGEGAWSFLYLKSSDNSTATPMTPIVYPSESAVPSSYFSNTDIGVTGIKGSTSYNAGTWTMKGAGTAPSNSSNFTFKPVKGDVAIVAKIENNSISGAVSGLMIRESLSTTSNYVSINFNPSGTINVSGVGSTAANSGYTHYSTSSSWWLKLERVGNRVFAYHSHDGVTWTNIALFIIPFPNDTYIGFYTASRNTSALNTATFTNVAVNNTFAVGSPEINSTTSAVATVGTAFNFNITATGTPTTFAATGLSTGLSINATTGVISGIPTTVGKSVVLLEATNANGTGKAALVIDVISNQAPIAINSLAVNAANSSIKLSWTVTDNATSYSVKRSLTSGGPYTTIQANITGTSFTDPSPAYEVSNYYVVTALVGENESTVSNEVFGSVPPAVPTNIAATNQNGQVNLTWNIADGASTYKVKRATTSGGSYTDIASVSTNTYVDNNVANGMAYYYVVSSKGTTLESAISSEVFGNPGTNSLTWNETPTSNIFSVATNWLENLVPINPAILTFKNTETSTLNNDLTGLVASRMLFDDNAVNYTITGNSITLKSDLVNNSAQNQLLTMPITLDGQLNVNAKNNSIELSGVVSGAGSLLKTGTSALIMSGANTYAGNTVIRGTKGYAWGSTDGIQVLGIGTGTSGSPTSGPLGTGKIIMEGGALYTGINVNPATLYNDIEVTTGNTGYFYERQGHLNLYGRLLGNGTFINDGSDNYATISLYGNNSSFTGTFITKLRSGNHRMAFMVPESGSANAAWLLDAVGVDCHRILYSSGALEFGSLSGRGGIRCNVAGTPIIRIGALNTNTNFSGTIANATGTLSVEKVGTGTLTFSGNSTFGGATTILNGTFLLNNSNSTGTYSSPIIAKSGSLGGSGRSTSTVTIGATASFVPGTDGTIGTFTTTGLVTLNTDATYKVDINSVTASCDKIIAARTSLNQAKLVLNIIVPATLPLGTTFTILENTGTDAITGTFKDLPEMALVNLGGYNFRITYIGGTGNDIQLLDDRATYTNSITTGIYYIKIAGTDSLLTKNTSSNSLTFGTIKSDKNLQRWRVTKEANGKYKIASIGDAPSGYNNYIDVNAQFGTEVYDSTLNTINLYRSGTRYAIQKTGNGGYWYMDKDTVRVQQGNSYSAVPSSFPFEFVLDIYYPLDAKLEEAKAIRDAAQTSTTQEVGKYPVEAKQTFSNVIATTQAHYDALVTADQVNAEILILTNAINEFKKTVYYNTNLLANGNYFIKIPNTESYWTKNTTNVPIFEALNTDRTNQIWNITKQSNGRFKITHESAPNSAYLNYINEGAQFGKNVYDATWNTMNVYFNGTTYAIQKAQKAGYGYWYINETSMLSTSSTTSSPPTSFPILLIPVASLQIITFNPLQTKTVGDVDFDGGATVNSSLPVSYTSSNPSVATIINGKIHIVGAGTTNITASQVGNGTFTSATPVTQTLTVVKKAQSITFNALANKLVDDTDFDAGATASSNLTVSYISSNPTVATIVNNKVHLVDVGTTTIIATQAGNATYLSATPVTQNLTVLKKSQSITFANIPNIILGDADFDAGAVASSNLTVSYTSSNPAVATIIDGKIHIVGTGTSTITASQTGNQTYNPANDVTQTLSVIATLKVKYQDGDNNLSNNQIKPNLTIYNEGLVAVPYNELTLRYWVTPENYAGINTWIDYAQLGNSNIKMKYLTLPEPRNGAFGYFEYSFETSAGNLIAGANSGQIQSRFANTNWANLSESDDYSYANSSNYAYNEHITMYRNGQLVWGVEPTSVPSVVNLKVYTETKATSTTTNTISTYLKINNEGNVPVAYTDVKVRYWFTKEGTPNLNYYLDYAALGTSAIESGFVTLSPIQTGANTYLQLGVKSSLGTFYPSSSTGNIQYRIAKTDWSNFNQADDYSYNTNTTMALNDNVTVYYKGQLIYGTEPSVMANGRISADIEETSNLDVKVFGNPVINDQCEVEISGIEGGSLTVTLSNIQGTEVYKQFIENPQNTEKHLIRMNYLTSGVYLLKVSSGTQIKVVKIIK